jgi:hypothetical protein
MLEELGRFLTDCPQECSISRAIAVIAMPLCFPAIIIFSVAGAQAELGLPRDFANDSRQAF